MEDVVEFLSDRTPVDNINSDDNSENDQPAHIFRVKVVLCGRQRLLARKFMNSMPRTAAVKLEVIKTRQH